MARYPSERRALERAQGQAAWRMGAIVGKVVIVGVLGFAVMVLGLASGVPLIAWTGIAVMIMTFLAFGALALWAGAVGVGALLGFRYATLASAPAKNVGDGTVKTYAIWNGTHIKIGRSRDPERRLKELEASIAGVTGVAGKLRFLTILDGDFERHLHQQWNSSRIAGEWFECDEKTKNLLNQFFATHTGTDARETSTRLIHFLTEHAGAKTVPPAAAPAETVPQS